MVSQADRELINNFVIELRPYLETVEMGAQEFSQPNRDGVIVGQAVQALMMIRGAGQILMVEGLVSISSWLVESFEKIQNNPEIAPPEATRRLTGLYNAMDDYLVSLERGDNVDPIVLRAKTIFEAIPNFGGPMPGTSKLRSRTDLDALFGDDEHSAQTRRITVDDHDTERLAAATTASAVPTDQTAEMPEAQPTVPLQGSEDVTQPVSSDAPTRRTKDAPARIVPIPPQPTEEIPKVDPELREIFEEEALEIITAFGDGIRELARNPGDQEAIRNLNRAAHTLKGAANMTGFPLIAQIGAAIELLFDEQLERGQAVGRDVLELVAVSWKMLRAMVPNLNDLSSFTSPSNSIVQRANVLREQLARAHANAETIAIDQQHYGPRAEAEAVAEGTDEIVALDVRAPAPERTLPEVDAGFVEAAPTVPLRRDDVEQKPADIVATPEPTVSEPEHLEPDGSEPEIAESEPAAEFTGTEAAATDEIVEPATAEPDYTPEADFEIVDEPATEAPFWNEPDAATEAEASAEDKPQSEPFWTPGTEELMSAAVGTDMLIADIQGLDDLDDEVSEAYPEVESDEFFTGVDADGSVELEESAPADDGSWLDEPERPQTDLLNFDSRPQTEPFWNTLSPPQSEPQEMQEPKELVTMDPFFKPVDPDTSFLYSPYRESAPEAEAEEAAIEYTEPAAAEEDYLVAEADVTAHVDEADAETSEPLAEADEVHKEGELVAGLEPFDPERLEGADDLPELPEAYVNGLEDDAAVDGDYSYAYAFDFEIETEAQPALEANVPTGEPAEAAPVEEAVRAESVEDAAREPFEVDTVSDVEVAAHTEAQPDTVIAIVPAFDGPVAEVMASAALNPEPSIPAPFIIESEPIVVAEHPAVEATRIDASIWLEAEAIIPAYVFQTVDEEAAVELAAMLIDTEAPEVAVDTPVEQEVEVEEDLVIETIESPEDTGEIEADVAGEAEVSPKTTEELLEEAPADTDDAEDVVVEAAEEAETTAEPEAEDIVIDEAGGVDAGEPAEDFTPDESHDETFAEPANEMEVDEQPETIDTNEDVILESDDRLREFDDVVASMETDDGLGDLDWFDEPDELVEESTPEVIESEETAPATEEADTSPPATGYLPDSGTGVLGGTTTDSLGFGSLDLDRSLTAEGSMALSSALLDMAFTAPPEDSQDDGLGMESISVFDESSERALAIEMFETFALEAEDHIATLNRAAMQFDRDPLANELLIEIKRALHTLKGAAAAADFMEISDLAHQLEDSLATQERRGTLNDRTFTAELFSAVEDVEARLSRRKDELFGVSEEEAQSGATLRIDVDRVDDLLNTVGELVVNRSSFEERLERLESTIEDLSTAAARLQRSSYLLEREASSEDAIGRLLRGELSGYDTGMAVSDIPSEWDMLEMDRYTEFDRLIRQLAEVGADVTTAVGEINALHGDFDTISNRQRRLTTALQDELMGIRMVPISSLAPRLYRVVRRAAGQRGKEVSLIIEGGETPFDKILLDTLSESLLHLLRNSVDHGIEDLDERRRLGKPEQGSIRIRAFRDGSEAVIEIIDDGAGIDHKAVIHHARERGMSVPDDISREEALLLIFEPGFTTKDEADDISGRGLGLEIVEQTVSRYKGRVAVDSVVGRGTVFSLRLPVMLSVIQAFLVSAGEGEFAIPVANVDYVVDRVDQPLTQIGNSVVIETANQIIPVVDVSARIGRSQTPVLEKDSGWVMVSEIAGKRWALVVDDLHGQQEIVVKPMGRFLRATPGLMGATILGHGDVALIVDVPALLGVDSLVTRLNSVSLAESVEQADGAKITETPAADERPAHVVLVVDDSLSVRRVVSRTIERHGWVAVLARDGVEALEMLEQGHADILLTDIEMPRMDGFELISAIRSHTSAEELPIVILTSRSGEKHRERALGLGANEYLVKPFQEQELIEVVENMSRASSEV